MSGSVGIMSGSTINQKGGSSSYGQFYPHAGLIILNGDMFKAKVGTGETLTQDLPQNNPGLSTNTDLNHLGMYSCISSSNHFIIDTEQFYFHQ